jgi:hypothetical protein
LFDKSTLNCDYYERLNESIEDEEIINCEWYDLDFPPENAEYEECNGMYKLISCNTNYSLNSNNNTCVLKTQAQDCGWNKPDNIQATNGTTYNQTWNTTKNQYDDPTSTTWTYNSNTTCWYTCAEMYHTEDNGKTCISNIKTWDCTWIPDEIAYVWHYWKGTQKWTRDNGWSTLSWSYSDDLVNWECNYKCNTNYFNINNDGICWKKLNNWDDLDINDTTDIELFVKMPDWYLTNNQYLLRKKDDNNLRINIDVVKDSLYCWPSSTPTISLVSNLPSMKITINNWTIKVNGLNCLDSASWSFIIWQYNSSDWKFNWTIYKK